MFDSLPTTVDNRYDVIAEIGRGAHAIVYRARDTAAGDDVAIKILRSDIVEPDVTARFAQEILITTQLEHPNISRVQDTGEWNGRPYFVSPLATGSSLETHIQRDGPLSVELSVAIVSEVADALAYAHRQGIVHRDVKPENILLTDHGALLADFGIARAIGLLNERALQTSTGIAVGTLLYMSPEQICADKQLDGRTDQYSLALVLYEMLTGVRPHESASIEGLRSLRLAGKQLAPRDHRPSISQHLSDAVIRALSPAPADRYATCADFAQALRTVRADAPTKRATSRAVLVTAIGGFIAVIAWFVYWRADDSARDGAEVSRGRQAVTRIALLADTVGTQEPARRAREALAGHLARWTDVQVLGGPSDTVSAAWRDLANAGVGIAVVLSVVQLDADSSSITVRARDAAGDRPLLSQMFSTSGGVPDQVLRRVAMRLVAGPAGDSAPGLETLREPRRQAVDRYISGWRALRNGRLDSAILAFEQANIVAPRFSAATYWKAQLLEWRFPGDPSRWKAEAERAIAAIADLNGADSLNAHALQALSANEHPRACALYRKALVSDPSNFVSWFGLGECQRLDRVVLRDSNSPSGFRFRSSYQEALSAYLESMEHLPSARLGALFRPAATSTYATTLRYRTGQLNDANGTTMAAFPALRRDSVVFWPITLEAFQRSGDHAVPATYMEAIRAGRQTFVKFSERWVQRAGDSYAAHLGRALALELAGVLRGDASSPSAPSALASLAMAERLANTVADTLEVLIARSRIHLRASDFPSAVAAVGPALQEGRFLTAASAPRLVPVAALLGRREAVRQLVLLSSRQSVDRSDGLPDWIAERYALAVEAAVMRDCSVLSAYLANLDTGLVTHFSPNELPTKRRQWFIPIARMSLPCRGRAIAQQLDSSVPLDRAAQAWAFSRDRVAKAILDSIREKRRGASASAVAWDVEFTEAWLLTQLGDSAEALNRLESGLSDLSGLSEHALDDVLPAVGLRRALESAVALGRSRGSASTSRWDRMFRAIVGDSGVRPSAVP